MKITLSDKLLFSIFLLIICTILFQSCGECPVTQSNPPKICEVRNATIIEFNPHLTKINDTTFVPVPEYSTQLFQFPDDNTTSGSLPNDERFKNSDQIILAQQTFADPAGTGNYKAVIYDIYPANSALVGDLLVVNVKIDSTNPFNNTAALRFYGKLSKFSRNFYSEDADSFCQSYVKQYAIPLLNDLRSSASDYGKNLANAAAHTYTKDNIVVLDMNDKPVTTITVPSNVQTSLLNAARSGSIDVTVQLGEVYYYKAKNGREFAVQIVDISRGIFPPNLKRVAIRFAALN